MPRQQHDQGYRKAQARTEQAAQKRPNKGGWPGATFDRLAVNLVRRGLASPAILTGSIRSRRKAEQ